MAKNCSICGKKLKLLEGKVTISDGVVCASCWASAGLDMSLPTMLTAGNKTSSQVRDLIEIEILKQEAQKAGLRQEITAAKKENKQEEEPKPIDIYLAVNKKCGVDFKCVGHPVINFEDLINGNEMIIGDGFIRNESDDALPEVRIVCTFDPAIIDPGHIYYKKGTFEAGVEGRFEIDDPPVNLEEYAKIKRTRNGKIKFTLFIGEKEIHTEECSMKIKPAPAEKMERLMEAVMYNEEKNASGPVNVFLYARDKGSYEIDLMRNPELLYSMYSNGKEQLIGDVYVSNETAKELKKIRFEAKFTSDILSPVNVLLGNVGPGEKVCFEVDDPAIDVNKLAMLTEIETCTATYILSVNGKTVAESTGRITICPYNQWNAALILLPAYMTPNHPNVINVLQNASKWMLINGMNPSLEGYQSDGKRVEEMVGAVYNAMREANIFYSNPPASFFGPQRIRLCETIFEQKFATCLDMTILFASCLESFGLHPVLITAPGHIFAGVWLTEKDRLENPVVSDAKLISKYIKEGRLVAIECTAMNAGKDISYEKAKDIANNIVKAIAEKNIEDHECIDVQIVRAIGVRPLPIRVQHPGYSEKRMPEQEISETPKAESAPAQQPKEEPVKEENVEKAEAPIAGSVDKTYTKEDYVSFKEDLTHISIENFYDKQTKKIIKEAIAEIVAVEGPISQPTLIRTIINTTSLGRATKQISEHLDKLVASADVKITRQNGVRFLWNHGTDPVQYMTYRVKEMRSPEDICKYELKNAVCYLLQENGPMKKVEITKAMIQMFGYNRSSKKIEDGAAAAIKAARELKVVEVGVDGKVMLV